MNFEWADWGPPLLVLGAAVLGGAAMVFRSTNNADATRMTDYARRQDLSKERDDAIQALKDLDLEQDKLAPEDFAKQRKSLVAKGAAAMRALDGVGLDEAPAPAPVAPAPVASPLAPELVEALARERARLGSSFVDALAATVPELRPAPSGMAPEWRGAVATMGVFAVIGALYAFAGSGAVDRGGGSMTGGMGGGMGGGGGEVAEAAPPDAETQQLLAAVEKDPKDLAAWNRLTTIALGNRDLATAMERNRTALEIAPQDPEGRTYRAVLTAMIGRAEPALAQLEEVLAEKPDFVVALIYHGLIAAEAGQTDKAVASLEKAIAAGAPNAAFLRDEVAKLKSGGGPGPGGDAAPPPPAGAPVVSGTITLADGVAPTGQVVFVSAKSPAGGPPLMAKRLPVGPFPMTFTLTEADRPMANGMPLPASFDITVRLDRDGNAMTHGDDEPSAKQAGVAPGAGSLEFVLR